MLPDTPYDFEANNMNLLSVMLDILENACPGPMPDENGWSTYYIETHCVAFEIVARKHNGIWEIDMYTKADC